MIETFGAKQLPQDVDELDIDLAEASILLVDDNQQNLELMQAYLEALPCSIRTASPSPSSR